MIKFPAPFFVNVHLLYLNHDIAFPSPTLVKVGDGAVNGPSTLWPDHAIKQANTASPRRLEQLIAADKDRRPEGREKNPLSHPEIIGIEVSLNFPNRNPPALLAEQGR